MLGESNTQIIKPRQDKESSKLLVKFEKINRRRSTIQTNNTHKEENIAEK